MHLNIIRYSLVMNEILRSFKKNLCHEAFLFLAVVFFPERQGSKHILIEREETQLWVVKKTNKVDTKIRGK